MSKAEMKNRFLTLSAAVALATTLALPAVAQNLAIVNGNREVSHLLAALREPGSRVLADTPDDCKFM